MKHLAIGFSLLGYATSSLASAETTELKPVEMVDLALIMPNATYDIRYASDNNFVGRVVDGYLAPKCFIHISAADKLVKANEALSELGLRFKIFDCYRPQKSVAHFMRWAKDLSDTTTKTEYYPNLPKSELVGDYIAEKSGHSRGYTIDLTIEQKQKNGSYQELDMGSPFDMFDTLSNTADSRVTLAQKKNRYLLKGIMEDAGFRDYSMEWWHFTYNADPGKIYLDFNIE